MCSERFSMVGLMLRGSIAEAERVLPGKGCELIEAFSTVGDGCLILGIFVGILLFMVFRDAVDLVLRSRRYRLWKETRNVD